MLLSPTESEKKIVRKDEEGFFAGPSFSFPFPSTVVAIVWGRRKEKEEREEGGGRDPLGPASRRKKRKGEIGG